MAHCDGVCTQLLERKRSFGQAVTKKARRATVANSVIGANMMATGLVLGGQSRWDVLMRCGVDAVWC